MSSKALLKSVIFALLVTVLINAVGAQSPNEYKFINAQNTATLEQELNQNATDGWRLFRFPQSWQGDAIGALLIRQPGQRISVSGEVVERQ